jgi:hypothetical protein
VIASDDFLANTLLETIKEGVLNCKIVTRDGKRSSDRSWRPAWAVLKKSGALFLCKEKKDNVMIPSSVDAYPIDLKGSQIDVAHDYTKRKYVFKLVTFSNSEYLFQTIDLEAMRSWIRAMHENSRPPDLEKLLAMQETTTSNTTPTTTANDSYNENEYSTYSNAYSRHHHMLDKKSKASSTFNNSTTELSANEQHSNMTNTSPMQMRKSESWFNKTKNKYIQYTLSSKHQIFLLLFIKFVLTRKSIILGEQHTRTNKIHLKIFINDFFSENFVHKSYFFPFCNWQ